MGHVGDELTLGAIRGNRLLRRGLQPPVRLAKLPGSGRNLLLQTVTFALQVVVSLVHYFEQAVEPLSEYSNFVLRPPGGAKRVVLRR